MEGQQALQRGGGPNDGVSRVPPITAPPTVWRRLMLTNTRDVPPHLAYRAPMLRVADTKSEELPPFLSSMGRCPKSGLHNPIKAPERYVMYGDVSFRCAGLRGGRWGPALDPDAGGGLATCRGAGFGKGAAFLAWWQEPCAAAGNCRRRCLSPEPSPPPRVQCGRRDAQARGGRVLHAPHHEGHAQGARGQA